MGNRSTFQGNSVELKAYDYEQTKLVSSKAQRNKNTIANNTNLTNTFYPTLGGPRRQTDLANNLAKRRSEYFAQGYQMVSIEAKHDLFEIKVVLSQVIWKASSYLTIRRISNIVLH